jgi:hypothetical protein
MVKTSLLNSSNFSETGCLMFLFIMLLSLWYSAKALHLPIYPNTLYHFGTFTNREEKMNWQME